MDKERAREVVEQLCRDVARDLLPPTGVQLAIISGSHQPPHMRKQVSDAAIKNPAPLPPQRTHLGRVINRSLTEQNHGKPPAPTGNTSRLATPEQMGLGGTTKPPGPRDLDNPIIQAMPRGKSGDEYA